jgi:hypothetical protein
MRVGYFNIKEYRIRFDVSSLNRSITGLILILTNSS